MTRRSSPSPLRIGILGTGFIAQYHALQFALAPEANRIAAVHDLDPGRAGSFARSHGAEVVGSADELAASCDAVVVCTWTAAHLEGVRAAASAGRPVLCEKPLGRDLAEARRIAAVVEEADLVNMVGLVLRSTPAMLVARELLRREGTGSVAQVVLRDDQYLPVRGMYASRWRADPELAGSGVLLEHSIHDVDLLEWLLGPVEVVAAQGAGHHGIDGIEDSVAALLRWPSGATASLATVWHDLLARPSQRRIEILCQRAMIVVEGEFFGPVRRIGDEGELVLEGDALVEWLRAEGIPTDSAQQQFLRAVRRRLAGGEVGRLRPDVADALRAHVVVDAVYRSVAEGGTPRRVGTDGG